MLVQGAATTISWIPSEAVSGIVYRLPFDVAVAHYDNAPPDMLPDIESYLLADRARFANVLRAWIDVQNGEIVDFGHSGAGHIGSTTLHLGPSRLRFMAHSLRDLQRHDRVHASAVRFEQTTGGRTGVPAPRRVSHAPYIQLQAPLAWTTVALTLHADGRQEYQLAGASPFPRHWLYNASGTLIQKSATIDYHTWSTTAYGRHTPWGDIDSPAMVADVETALERQLSTQIMKTGAKPQLRRLPAHAHLITQGEIGKDLYLVLDGVLRVDVDGEPVAEVGPGAVVGERFLLQQGRRTSSVIAMTPCLVAIADPSTINPEDLQALSTIHHREDPEPT